MAKVKKELKLEPLNSSSVFNNSTLLTTNERKQFIYNLFIGTDYR